MEMETQATKPGDSPTNSITDPAALGFVGATVRPGAEALWNAYAMAKMTIRLWFGRSYGDLIPVSADLIGDGDTRYPITGNDVVGIINRCQELVDDYEANGNAKLNTILKVARIG